MSSLSSLPPERDSESLRFSALMLEKRLPNIQGSIALVESELRNLGERRDRITLSITRTSQQLATLRAALPGLEAELNDLYIRGNRALRTVQSTNGSLTAASARFRAESDALAVANYNIQQARAEQQEIAARINLLVQENTAGLPYASAPLESGLTTNVGVSNQIDSINAFLLRAYGSSLHLDGISRYAATQFLYAFGQTLNRGGCAPIVLSGSAQAQSSSFGSLMANEGTIESVINGNTWIVQTDSGAQTVQLDKCTVRLANNADYQATRGDRVIWKGSVNDSTWQASQVTCLQ